jgi:hypothetical protein
MRTDNGSRVNNDILFLELPKLRLEFIEVRICFSFGVCQGLLDHQELVEFMCDIKVGLFHLEESQIDVECAG